MAGGARVFAKGRGNRQANFSWTVEREHADLATAQAFSFNHAALVPINVSVAITSPTVGYSSGVISAVECVKVSGRTTQFRYTIEGAVPSQ